MHRFIIAHLNMQNFQRWVLDPLDTVNMSIQPGEILGHLLLERSIYTSSLYMQLATITDIFQ